jgi:hypothetical protein
MSDPRTFGVQALRYWFDASSLPALHMSTWGDALSFYDHGTFISGFGKAVRDLEQSKTKSAMQKLGKKFGYLYPSESDFFNFLADEAGTVSGSQIAEAAGQGVLDAGKAVTKLASSSLLI